MNKLLLLHGALGSKAQLDPLAKLLQPGFDTWALNFSGHGGAPFAPAFGIESFAAETLDFLNRNSLEKVDIFGYSMGGYVALHLARLHPQRVGRIVTLATKFDWTPASAERESKMLDPEKIEAKVPAFAQQLEERHLPNDWKLVLRKTAAMMHQLGQQPLLTPEVLAQIGQPTLVCLGDADQMVGIAETKLVAESLPFGQLHLLSQTPHPLEKVDLNLLADVVRAFFQPG